MTTMSNVGVGDLVDSKYRLLRIIGEGGWGIVFEGENARTLKRVAIKILRARADLTVDIRTRFEREAQAAGRIGSDHIVEVFDLGTLADGSHYMVMELLAGEDLAARLRSIGRLEPMLAAKLAMQLLEGLAAAHEAGIMHRDLKPENLFLVPTRSGEDFVKILDFGISKFTTPGMSSATMTGAILGSPCYMAPEQARGLKNVDPRTDLYSVGTLLFECVTGRVPFDGDNFNDLMFKIALAPRPNPLEFRPDLDTTLVSILVKAIQADANQRFQTAEEFRDALGAWLESLGVASLRTPDLRRPSRTTPRVPGALAATPTPSARMQKASWVEATAAVDSGASTPLSAASSLERQPPPRPRKTPVFAAMAGFMLVAALVGAFALRQIRHPLPSEAPAASASPPAPSSGGESLPTATAATVVPLPRLAEASPAESSATLDLEGASSAVAHTLSSPPVPAGGVHGAVRPGAPSPGPHPGPGASSKTPGAEPSPKAAEVAPAPPPSPSKSVESVEGRAIQTGL
jgi:serine/threonine protein kinase